MQRPTPPLLLAGHGDKLLTLAARYADIVGFSGFDTTAGSTRGEQIGEDAFAERVAFLHAAVGERLDDLELNLLVQAVGLDGAPPDSRSRRRCPTKRSSRSRVCAADRGNAAPAT